MECSFDSHPSLYIYTMYILGVFALSFNLFGSYCVIKKTPAHLTEYRRTLLYYQLCVSMSDFFLAFVITPVPFVPFPIFFSAGLISLINVRPAVALAGCMAAILQAYSATFHLFHYRLMVILPPDSIFKWGRKALVCFRMLTSILFLSPFIIIPLAYESEELAIYTSNIRKLYKCVDEALSHHWVHVSDPTVNKLMYLYIGCIVGILWLLSTVVALATYIVLRRMKATSEKTHHLQQKFQLILIVQTISPIFIIGIPGWIMIALYLTDNFEPQWLGLLFMVTLSIHGLFGNVIMVVFNSDYYRFAKQSLKRLTTWKLRELSSNDIGNV